MRGYATSSNNGSFSINAERGDSLTFTMLGFQEVHIAVKGDMKPLTVKWVVELSNLRRFL